MKKELLSVDFLQSLFNEHEEKIRETIKETVKETIKEVLADQPPSIIQELIGAL